MTVNDEILEFWWGQSPSKTLPHFEQLSFFTRLHPTSLSKVMTV